MPPTTLPDAPDAPRPPWRGLALLTAAVVLAHLALLALAPPFTGPRPSPLANTFITRSIVVAPPPAPEPAAAAAPAVKPAPPPPRPVRPRPAARPRPAVEPAPTPAAAASMPPEAPPNDLIAQAAIDAGDAQAPEATAGAPTSGASGASGAGGAGGGETAGTIAGPVALQISGSVRLAFAATAQQGAQPLQGVFGELVWLQDGSHYDATLSWTFLFKTLRSQPSAGNIGPTGIEPLRFSDKRKTEVTSHFERDKGLVVFSNNAPSVMLLAGAQDRLSVVLQLGALLAGDPARYPSGA